VNYMFDGTIRAHHVCQLRTSNGLRSGVVGTAAQEMRSSAQDDATSIVFDDTVRTIGRLFTGTVLQLN